MLTSKVMILPDLIVHRSLDEMALLRYGGIEKGPIMAHGTRASRWIPFTIRLYGKIIPFLPMKK